MVEWDEWESVGGVSRDSTVKEHAVDFRAIRHVVGAKKHGIGS